MALPSLKRSKKDEPEVAEPVVLRPGSKGYATPKRSEKSGPAVGAYMTQTTGRTRRESAKLDKERRNSNYSAARSAMKGTGDVKDLPVRDARPEAAFARDFVDNRRNLVTLVGLGYILFALNIVTGGQFIILTLLLTIFFVAIVDAFLLSFLVGRAAKKEFPDSREKIRLYAVQRAIMPRRFRLPRAGVAPYRPRR